MKRYSFGSTPETVIENCLPEVYDMELIDSDYHIFAALVNVGIDSRLQAIIINNKDIKCRNGKAVIKLNKASMICLVNRLLDYSELGSSYNPNILTSYESEQALDLRSCILQTIGIEEV